MVDELWSASIGKVQKYMDKLVTKIVCYNLFLGAEYSSSSWSLFQIMSFNFISVKISFASSKLCQISWSSLKVNKFRFLQNSTKSGVLLNIRNWRLFSIVDFPFITSSTVSGNWLIIPAHSEPLIPIDIEPLFRTKLNHLLKLYWKKWSGFKIYFSDIPA